MRIGASTGLAMCARKGDLLRPAPEVVEKLRALLGDSAPRGVKGVTPEEVALLVHALHDEPAQRREGRAAGWTGLIGKLKPPEPGREGVPRQEASDLIAQMQQTHPHALDGIPPEKARLLVSHLFKHIQDNLAHTSQPFVAYSGLGRFRVRKIQQEMAGRKVSRTHVVFHPALPR